MVGAFKAITRLGSYSKAADELGYTKAGIGYIVNSMEEAAGFRIFRREYGGVRLTPEGEALLPAIRAMVKAADRLQEEERSLLTLTTGCLYIGSYFSTAAHWLPSILSLYQKRYPLVQVHLKECGNRECLEGVAEGTLSCAFLSRREEAPVQWLPLRKDRLHNGSTILTGLKSMTDLLDEKEKEE